MNSGWKNVSLNVLAREFVIRSGGFVERSTKRGNEGIK